MGGTNLSDQSITNGGTVNTYFTNDSGHAILVRCTTANIPSGKANFAVGCHLEATDTGIWYSNTGTTASCTFTVSSLTATGNKGYFVVEKTLTGTTPVNIFGTTNGFAATVTGVYLITAGTVSGAITLATTGTTIATVTASATLGNMVGAQTLNSTAISTSGTFTAVSNNASDLSRIFVVFTTP